MIRNTLIFVFVALFAWGCATTPEHLVDARQTYKKAAESNASQYVPDKVREAKKALDQAEQSYEEYGADEPTTTLSYVAKRKAQHAMISADVYAARQDQEQKQALLMKQNEQARKSLMSQLEEASQYAKMTSRELEEERQRLEGAQAELESERIAGKMTEAELAEERARLAQLNTELEAERKARELAQKNLAETREALEKVASIKEEQERMTITLTGEVLFQTDKAQLRPVAERRLDQVAEVLLAERNAEIVVEGHTDSQGKASYNEKLSQDRAQAVRDYLVSKGIANDRIKAVGKGESNPVAPNDTPEGRANNRRVEIVVDRRAERASL